MELLSLLNQSYNMATTPETQIFNELMTATDAVIQEATVLLEQNGTKLPLTDWVTPAEYAKRFGLKSTNVVSNWIRRGVIPAENKLNVPKLNDIQLIKAVPYPGNESHR